MSEHIAEERLYLTDDKQTVVRASDPRAAWLLVAEGQPIPTTHVDAVLDLYDSDAIRDAGGEAPSSPSTPAKKAAKRDGDKKAKPAPNKAAPADPAGITTEADDAEGDGIGGGVIDDGEVAGDADVDD